MKNKAILWVIGIFLVALFIGSQVGLFSITGNERMSRSYPSTADPGAIITVTYTVTGASGLWGASVIDTLTCPGIANQEKRFVIISDEGTTKTIQYTLPNVEGLSCSFIGGSYQFGSQPLINFNTQIISTRITTVTNYTKACYDNDVYWYNSKGVLGDKFQECGVAGCANGVCRVCRVDILYDTDCDGIISRTELGTSINKWINNQINRDVLGQIIQAWAN